jgi:hypothetical protein
MPTTTDPRTEQAVKNLQQAEDKKQLLIQMRMAMLSDIQKLTILANDDFFGDLPMMEIQSEMLGPDHQPAKKLATPKEALAALKQRLENNLNSLKVLDGAGILLP